MKTFFLCLVMLSAIRAASTQGSLTYQGTLGVGRENYIYKPDPLNPTIAKIGGQPTDYVGFEKVAGIGYTAELWFAPGSEAAESSLQPVQGSQVAFRTGATAGLINGKSKLDIQGACGGDVVTLQLRVWNNENGLIRDWYQALEKGKSKLFDHILAGVAADGSPHLGTGSVVSRYGNFSLAIPEPSLFPAMGACLLGMAWALARAISGGG